MLQRDPERRFPDLDLVANAIEGAMPECVGTAGRAAVAAFVEQMAGPELRERMRRIEEGAEVTNFTPRPGTRVSPASSASSASSASPAAAPGTGEAESSSTGHAEGTSPGTRTVPARGLAQARQGGAAASTSSPPARRRGPLVAAAVVVAVVIAVVFAVVFAGGAPDPNTLTVRYLEEGRPGRALVLREELLEDAVEHQLDPVRVDPIAATLAGLCNERLDLLRTHHGHDEQRRAADRAAVAQQERLLQEKARAALEPLGGDYAVAALDMWAEECWAPIRWLEPTPAPDVQAAVKTRIVPQIEDTAAWREAVVRRLLRRAGVDVEAVMARLWPLVKEREGLIARYGSVTTSQMPSVQAGIKDLEARGHAALKGLAPDFENAVVQIAFIGFDDVDAPVPLFSYLPSVQAREPGAR
jgi:hypothetical protein